MKQFYRFMAVVGLVAISGATATAQPTYEWQLRNGHWSFELAHPKASSEQTIDIGKTSAAYADDLKAAMAKHQLVVKGFFLGMSKDEVIYLIKTKYPREFSVGGSIPFKEYFSGMVNRIQMATGRANALPTAILFDKSGGLSTLHLEPEIVNSLFNVADMSPPEFTKAFINAYDVPSMDAVNNDPNASPYWKYASPDGYDIIILQDKTLVMRTTPKPTERSFN